MNPDPQQFIDVFNRRKEQCLRLRVSYKGSGGLIWEGVFVLRGKMIEQMRIHFAFLQHSKTHLSAAHHYHELVSNLCMLIALTHLRSKKMSELQLSWTFFWNGDWCFILSSFTFMHSKPKRKNLSVSLQQNITERILVSLTDSKWTERSIKV